MQITKWFQSNLKRHKADAADKTVLSVGADRPIHRKSEDRLRRAEFADRIATVLSEAGSDEGCVFAIRGSWGYGKTSLMNLVIEQLVARDDGCSWLEFNPWQWGDADSIAKALFQQIADKLGGKFSSPAAQRAKAFRRYGAVLTGIREPLKAAKVSTQTISSVLTGSAVVALAGGLGLTLPTAAIIAGAIAVIGIVVPIVGSFLSAIGRDRWAVPLDDVRRSLEGQLRTLEKPLIVFVDDIDRLEPDQIRLLFRQVKVNANLPNIVFVMLFQPSIVEAALDPIADNQGREFLEKIVQANFDLPAVPRATVHRVFVGELAALVDAYATKENGFEQVRWGNVLIGCIQPYVRNLRDARRLLSSIAIHLPLHIGGIAFEVNIIDFLALETLRVFEPELHAALFDQRDLVLQVSRFAGDGRKDGDRESAKNLIEPVLEERRKVAQAAVQELFPTLAWAFGGTNYTPDWRGTWTASKRVCTERFFPRYFELQTAEGELSESAFVDFLSASNDGEALSQVIVDIEERGLLPSLAARLDESVERLPGENAAVLLPAMFKIAQSLAGSDSADGFNSAWTSAWRATSWYIDKIPVADRGQVTLDALRQTGALSVAAILIHLNDPADREERQRDVFEPKLDAQTLQSLKDEWLRQVREIAKENGPLLTHSDLGSILYRWRDYTGSLDEPKAWVTSTIRKDDGFRKFILGIMGRGTRQTAGDRVASRFEHFNQKTITDFIGIDECRRRLEKIGGDGVVGNSGHALDVLRNQLKEWSVEAPEA